MDRSLLDALRMPEEARKPKRRRGWWILGAGVLVLLAGMLFGRSSPKVTVARAEAEEARERAVLLAASGYVTPRRRATVAAKVTARVLEVRAEEGMVVRAGDILARLDDSDAQKQLATAQAQLAVNQAALGSLEAELKNARAELLRQRELLQAGVGTQQATDAAETRVATLQAQLEQAKKAVELARARVGEAQQAVENCVVRAPFAGVVVTKDAQPGEMVSPISAGGGYTRTGIATVVDMGSLEIEVDVNEAFITQVFPGQDVEATLDAYPDWVIPGTVRAIIPTADRQKATVKVRVALGVQNPRILPDMGVKVAFLGNQAASKTQVKVPAPAVREEEGKNVVYVLSGHRVHRREVVVSQLREGEALLEKGVAPGEEVVVAATGSLRDGRRVRR